MEVLLRRWARKRSQWRVPMCAGEEAVADGGYVGEGAADVDDEAGERAGGVELRYGGSRRLKAATLKRPKRILARPLVGVAGEAREEGGEDGRLVLDAAQLEAGEEDVFPVDVPDPQERFIIMHTVGNLPSLCIINFMP